MIQRILSSMAVHANRIFKPLFLFSLVTFTTISCTNSPKKNQAEELTSTDKLMVDSIIGLKYNCNPISGLAVGLVIGDQTYTRTMGYSDVSKQTPFTDSTLFCTGIISETFTSSLALALNNQFDIDLNEPVSKYLPHFSLNSKTYNEITIKHLLTQTSGVPRHGLIWDLPNMSDSALFQTTWSIRLQEPEFEKPGTRVVRSPYNFDIAADLIGSASKMRFQDFAAQYMLKPLKMQKSTYNPDNIFKTNYAKPHLVNNWLTYEYAPTNDYPINGEHAGSIGLHTTIEETTHWISMLVNNGKYNKKQILPSKLVAQMMSPVFKTDQKTGSAVGLGWEIKNQNGTQIFIKSGTIGGFDHALVIIPQFNMGVMVATNAQSDFEPAIFAQELLFNIKNKTRPNYRPSIHIEMGRILNSTNSIDEAISFFNKVYQNNQGSYFCSDLALSQFGSNLLYRLGRETDALKVFETCLAIYPNSVYAHLNLAEFYLYQKNIEKTENKLIEIEKIVNNEPDVVSRIKTIKGTLELLKEKAAENKKPIAENKKDSICIPCEDEANLN